jgi:O-antigen ligase
MLFAAGWSVEAAVNFEAGRRRTDTAWIVGLAASFTVLIALVAAQAVARSRAGLGLSIVALFGTFALALSDRRSTSVVTPARLLVGSTALAVIFAVQYALYRVMQRFTEDPLQDARIAFARNTIEAAKAYMPFGSGMGTFVPVYAGFEKPQGALVDAYVNRAHNDILELWLEAGIIGIGLLAVFLVWLAIASLRVWRRDAPSELDVDRLLARAATIIIGLVIAHSLVDYPLRTGAMMAILAFACALLVEPPLHEGRAVVESVAGAAQREADPTTRSPMPAQPLPGPAASPLQGGARWGEGLEWPDEWRQDNKHRAPGAYSGPREPDND